jgi:N-acetylneuraminic acid mutarotase
LLNAHFSAAAATTLPLGPPDAQGRREPFPFLARTYAIGGSGALNDVEAYATQSNAWKNAPLLPTARLELAATVGGPDLDIYAVGGSDGTNPLNTLEAFTPSVGLHFRGGGEWNALAPMPTARTRLAAATGRDGRIYAFGGFDGSTALKTTEVYDIKTDTWKSVASMNIARDGVAGATGPDGRIYAIGGFDNVHYLSSVEAYDPTTDRWTAAAPMANPRMSLGAATAADKRIYAIGGEFSFHAVNIVEAYDPATNTWVAVTPMTTPRRALAAAVGHDGRIYAIGGIDDLIGVLSSVEAFSL